MVQKMIDIDDALSDSASRTARALGVSSDRFMAEALAYGISVAAAVLASKDCSSPRSYETMDLQRWFRNQTDEAGKRGGSV
jgi:hypothetical protein